MLGLASVCFKRGVTLGSVLIILCYKVPSLQPLEFLFGSVICVHESLASIYIPFLCKHLIIKGI